MVEPTLRASGFSLLMGTMPCYLCQASTPTAAIWVGDYEDMDEQAFDPGSPAVLQYIVWLDEASLTFIQGQAPWLRFAATSTSGTTYLANHCITCGAVQGDHFVFSPDGPYWPQTKEEARALDRVHGSVELVAIAGLSQSSWMDWMSD